jgi:penicillin-binding protein 2B
MRQRLNWRVFLLGLVFVLLFTSMGVRLWWIQSVEASWIMEQAMAQWERDKDIKPKRGSILDRNLETLAYEGKAYIVRAALRPRNEKEAAQVEGNYVQDPVYTATKLAPILKMPTEELIASLSRTDTFWVDLGKVGRNKISEEQKDAILALQYPKDANGETKVNQLPGIFLVDTTKR